MKKALLIHFILLFTLCSFGQSKDAIKYYEKAKADYDGKNYALAIANCKLALTYEKNYDVALYYLGASYYYKGLYQEAIETFMQLEKTHPDYWAWFYYWWGQCYDKQGELAKAVEPYRKFLEKFNTTPKNIIYDHRVKYKLHYAINSQVIRNNPKRMKDPVNMGQNVNSKWEDSRAKSNPTGKLLYFTSKRKGGYDITGGDNEKGWGEDIYYIEKSDDGWSLPVLLPEPINSYGNEGSAEFSGDGQTMVYGACGRKGGIGGCDLYISTLEGSKWLAPVNMGGVVNSENWDAQPTISADGNTIIFTSNRRGGYGSTDLYLVKKNKFGDWSVPVNLGDEVNTPFWEESPFLSSDGKTLYFSSSGHPGFGGMDLFKTVNEGGGWNEPVNLGAPLNTDDDDKYFTIDGAGETGYFASTREGGYGNYDIYSIEIPENMRPQPTVVVSGVVRDAKSQTPVGAWVLIEDLNTGELISVNKSNEATGKYLVVLPSGRNYSVSANKEGYFFYSQLFEVEEKISYLEIIRNIDLKPIEKGAKIVLNNVFFETGKAILTPESKLELEKAFDILKNNTSMIIEVGGHTDNVGNDEFNMKLSHNRAKAVREYLVNAGIASDRIQAKGYGETNPVAENDTDEGRKANRRTEFIILEF